MKLEGRALTIGYRDRVVGRDLNVSVEEGEVLRTALSDPSALEKPVDAVMGPALPVVDAHEPADAIAKLLAARNPAVLVRENGAVQAILTRFDMLQFIAGGE